jgi:hypothetical protein
VGAYMNRLGLGYGATGWHRQPAPHQPAVPAGGSISRFVREVPLTGWWRAGIFGGRASAERKRLLTLPLN